MVFKNANGNYKIKGGFKLLVKILRKIRSKKAGYEIGRKILSSSFVTNNSIYDSLYDKKINKTIEKIEKRYPVSVHIASSNYCNASCIMCPHSKLKKFGNMNNDLYKKIIDNCKKLKIKNLVLSFFGEPLIDKNLLERIKYAKSSGMSVGFSSNASLLTKKWARDLIESGLDSITISLDGYSKETYEKIRLGLKFDVVKENILGLVEMKKKMNKQNPSINLVLVEMEENKREIKNFYGEWKNKVQGINIINMRNWAGTIEKETTKESFHSKKNMKRKPCVSIWTEMYVDWEGKVVLCCDDWNSSVILGDLNKQSIEEIWRGGKLNKIRQAHKNREFHKAPLCNQCNKKTVWWLFG